MSRPRTTATSGSSAAKARSLTCKYVELTLTSQTWRGIVWKHQLFLVKPAQVNPAAKHALLMIAGGNWKEELADPKTQLKLPGEAQLLALVAEQLKTPVAILLHVPQQPIFDGKREDEIIAYTFREFLKTGDSDLAAPGADGQERRAGDGCDAGGDEEGMGPGRRRRSRSPARANAAGRRG